MLRRHRTNPSRFAGTVCSVPCGVELRLTHVDLPPAERLRLAEFGLRPGAELTVLSRTAGGGLLVGFGSSRVALDRRTARLLQAVRA